MTACPSRSTKPWLSGAWPYLLLLALTGVFFWDSLFAGKVLCMRDTFCDLFPFRQFAASAFRDGAMPLWNSVSGFGKPFLADPVAGAFYPPHLLFVILPATLAFKLSYVFHFFIAGAGMFALMRRWKFSTGAALLSAVVFTFNTWLMAWAEFFCSFNVIVWWPFTMLVSQRLLDRELDGAAPRSVFLRARRNFAPAVLLGVLLAGQYFAGSPELVLYSLLVIGAFVALRCACAKNPRAFAGCVVAFGIAGVITLLLVLPQFLLSLEFIGNSERSGAVNPRLESASFHPANLLTLVFPFIYGRPGYPQEFWAQSIYEFCLGTCYLGIVPLITGFFALSLWKRRATDADQHRFITIFFFAVATLGLLMAAGRYTPLYEIVYAWVPLFRHFRWPTKFLVWVMIGGSVLAGAGLEAFFKMSAHQKNRRRWTVGILAAWTAPWLIFLSLHYLLADRTSIFKWLTLGRYVATDPHLRGVSSDFTTGLVFVGLALVTLAVIQFANLKRSWSEGMLIGLTFLNLFVVSRQVQFIAPDDLYEYQPGSLTQMRQAGIGAVHSSYSGAQQYLYGSTDPRLWRWAKDAAVGATWLPYAVPHNWQGGLKLERHLNLYQALDTLPPDKSERLANIMGLRYVISGPPFENMLLGRAVPHVTLTKRPKALPRAFLVPDWKIVSDMDEALRELTNPAFDPEKSAVIESAQPLSPSTVSSSDGVRGALPVADNWNRVAIEVGEQAGGLLVLNDAWYPGWKVRVDGKEQPLLRANILFRGVALPAGRHKVEFSYEPWQFRFGGLVSIVTLLGVVVPMFARGLIRRSRPGHD